MVALERDFEGINEKYPNRPIFIFYTSYHPAWNLTIIFNRIFLIFFKKQIL